MLLPHAVRKSFLSHEAAFASVSSDGVWACPLFLDETHPITGIGGVNYGNRMESL